MPRESSKSFDAPSGANASHRADDDAALVERLRANDEHALDVLMRAYAPRLGALAYQWLGRRDLVLDVVQDAFVTLWQQRATLDSRNLGGYLYRTVRNRALDVLRHERRQHNVAERAWEGGEESVENAAEPILHAADVKAQLYAALEHVPPSPRRVFLLNWEGELSYAEIAELLGVTIKSVRESMYRATQRLAQHLRLGPEPPKDS